MTEQETYTQNHDGLNYYIDPERGDVPPHKAYRTWNDEQRQQDEAGL